jgi:hypothetical protein
MSIKKQPSLSSSLLSLHLLFSLELAHGSKHLKGLKFRGQNKGLNFSSRISPRAKDPNMPIAMENQPHSGSCTMYPEPMTISMSLFIPYVPTHCKMLCFYSKIEYSHFLQLSSYHYRI